MFGLRRAKRKIPVQVLSNTGNHGGCEGCIYNIPPGISVVVVRNGGSTAQITVPVLSGKCKNCKATVPTHALSRKI